MAKALITGISGQDGHYLAELLVQQGFDIVGVARNVNKLVLNLPNSVTDRIQLEQWNYQSQSAINRIFSEHQPAHAYNCAAISSGSGMFAKPARIGVINGVGVTRILDAIRTCSPSTRFCQASSAEMFGEPAVTPQDESTAFNPRSPYGAAKLYAHSMVGIYRRTYQLHACSAILFNHESPRRGPEFVTRRVTSAAARIKLGLAEELTIGNLDSRRDWGFAGDFAQAMVAMLMHPRADDYVVATGETHSVRELCAVAFEYLGLDYRQYVRVDSSSFRPSESVQLVGNPAKIETTLGWRPRHKFEDIVTMMVDADLRLLSNQ